MRKLYLSLIIGILASPVFGHDALQNASNLTRGTLPNARLDPSSVTLQGNDIKFTDLRSSISALSASTVAMLSANNAWTGQNSWSNTQSFNNSITITTTVANVSGASGTIINLKNDWSAGDDTFKIIGQVGIDNANVKTFFSKTNHLGVNIPYIEFYGRSGINQFLANSERKIILFSPTTVSSGGFTVTESSVTIRGSGSGLQVGGISYLNHTSTADAVINGKMDAGQNNAAVVISSMLANSGVTGGSYTNADITVNAQGIITSASNGSAGGASTSSLSYGLMISTNGSLPNIFVATAAGIDIGGCYYANISTQVDISTPGAGGNAVGKRANTWYSFRLISNAACSAYGIFADSGNVTLSTSLPSGYTKQRLIGFGYVDASFNIVPTFKVLNRVTPWQSVRLFDAVNPGASNTFFSLVNSVSPKATLVTYSATITGGASFSWGEISPANTYGATATSFGQNDANVTGIDLGAKNWIIQFTRPIVDGVRSIRHIDPNAAADSIDLDLTGYEEGL